MNMDNERLKVYSWEFPVRFTHWINFLCIIALSVTGFYIGKPFMHAVSSKQYVMGWMRFIHFTAAYVFLLNMIIRIYWGFMGNKCASFKWWFPSSAEWLRDFGKSLMFYLFLRKKSPSVGHTALAGFTYLIVFAIFIFEIISGFALYSVNHSGVIWTLLGGWLSGVMYLQTIRLYHHLFMYVVLAFSVLHVYSAWYCDLRENNGLMGSIFNGYKYLMGKECGE
jgi:Ni/Fe-hydrogenase 1 B-type cytochrome subunit